MAPGAILKRETARALLSALEIPEHEGRRGYGPQDRRLSPAEGLAFASMQLLYRDDELGIGIKRLSHERPTCPEIAWGVPTRSAVEHVRHASQKHKTCRVWLEELVKVARELGCPSLDLMLLQLEAATRGIHPGGIASTRLRSRSDRKPGDPASIRRQAGTIDRPARDLLARRAHAVGGVASLRSSIADARRSQGLEPVDLGFALQPVARGGWAGVEFEFDQLIGAWERGVEPHRRDVTYPTWREWWRNPERRDGRGRDRVRLEDSARLDADDLGQTYRKGAARIRKLLEAGLPDLG